jgi:hypothetical protein
MLTAPVLYDRSDVVGFGAVHPGCEYLNPTALAQPPLDPLHHKRDRRPYEVVALPPVVLRQSTIQVYQNMT